MRLRSLFISIRRVCSHLKNQTRENKYKNAAFCTDTLRFHLTGWCDSVIWHLVKINSLPSVTVGIKAVLLCGIDNKAQNNR